MIRAKEKEVVGPVGVVSDGPQAVRKIKVDPSVDRRRRQAGDEGEQWALAATISSVLALSQDRRRQAVDELVTFLTTRFEGDVVSELAEHGTRARGAVDDDEDFVDHLSRLIHVSAVSDAFGFDVLGWDSPGAGDSPRPMCLEVKSSGGGTFHLSTGEWSRAQTLHDLGLGDRYAVLVVVRSRGGGPPARMDLLPDPVGLVGAGHLARTADGYIVAYEVGPRCSGADGRAR